MGYLQASLLTAETEHMKHHLQTKNEENMVTEKNGLHFFCT